MARDRERECPRCQKAIDEDEEMRKSCPNLESWENWYYRATGQLSGTSFPKDCCRVCGKLLEKESLTQLEKEQERLYEETDNIQEE